MAEPLSFTLSLRVQASSQASPQPEGSRKKLTSFSVMVLTSADRSWAPDKYPWSLGYINNSISGYSQGNW